MKKLFKFIKVNAIAGGTSPVIEQLVTQVTETKGVEASAVVFLDGLQARIDAAIAEALANGATAAELQPVSDVSNEMKAQTDALAAALIAHGG